MIRVSRNVCICLLFANDSLLKVCFHGTRRYFPIRNTRNTRFKDPFVRSAVSVSPLIARENPFIFSPPSPRVLFLIARHFLFFFLKPRGIRIIKKILNRCLNLFVPSKMEEINCTILFRVYQETRRKLFPIFF